MPVLNHATNSCWMNHRLVEYEFSFYLPVSNKINTLILLNKNHRVI